jgi:hypothetical protein
MNAFAAAEQNGKAGDLQEELQVLFERQNVSGTTYATAFLASLAGWPCACVPMAGTSVSSGISRARPRSAKAVRHTG